MARHDCVTLSPGGLVSIMEPNGVYNGTIDPNLIPTQQGDGEDFRSGRWGGVIKWRGLWATEGIEVYAANGNRIDLQRVR